MNRPGADPRTEPAWLTRIKQGYTLLQQGRAEIAERVGREVLDSRPGDAGALNLVAIALNAQGKHADAAQLFAELTRLQPQERPDADVYLPNSGDHAMAHGCGLDPRTHRALEHGSQQQHGQACEQRRGDRSSEPPPSSAGSKRHHRRRMP